MPRSVISYALALALLLAADAAPAKPPLSKSAQRAAARSARPAPAAPSPEEQSRLLFEQKCTKCHDLAKASSAAFADDAWQAHLRRMGKLPGAAITDEQATQIHAFLKAQDSAAAR